MLCLTGARGEARGDLDCCAPDPESNWSAPFRTLDATNPLRATHAFRNWSPPNYFAHGSPDHPWLPVHPGRVLSNILSLDENIDSIRGTQVVSIPQQELLKTSLNSSEYIKDEVDTLAQAGVPIDLDNLATR